MTKTTLQERFDEARLLQACHCNDCKEQILSFIKQEKQLSVRETEIKTLKEMALFFQKTDWHGTGKAMVEDYAQSKGISLITQTK